MEFRFQQQRFVQRVCWLELIASVMKLEEVGSVYLEGWGGDREDWQKEMWARSQ